MNGNVWAAYVAVWAVVGVALAVPRPTEQHRKSYSYEPAATLKLNSHGKLKILQFADMHYENGAVTACQNVPPGMPCSDLNTTEFLRLLLLAEKPDFVVFTGDNIDGGALDAKKAVLAWSGVLEATLPGVQWAAVEGNHDQESTATRSSMMDMLSQLPHSVAASGPPFIHGYGNYFAKVVDDDDAHAFTLYFLDSGDSSKLSSVSGYDWVWTDQQAWFMNVSTGLQTAAGATVPALAFFHICLPEYTELIEAHVPISGVQQEACGSASVDSGLFTAFLEAGDVKVMTVGHDHVNDYCGRWHGIELCYGGGAGFHAYGKTGWARRARFFELDASGTITTWKRLDPWLGSDGTGAMKTIDQEQLYPPQNKTQARSNDYVESMWRPDPEQEDAVKSPKQ